MSRLQLEAYAITLLVEGIVAFFLAPRFGVPARRAALAAILGSAISHPIFWPSAIALSAAIGALAIPLLEICVVLAESLAYRLLATPRWTSALLLSGLVNLASWAAGWVILQPR